MAVWLGVIFVGGNGYLVVCCGCVALVYFCSIFAVGFAFCFSWCGYVGVWCLFSCLGYVVWVVCYFIWLMIWLVLELVAFVSQVWLLFYAVVGVLRLACVVVS